MMEARPMPTDCISPQLAFEAFEGRQVVGGFDGGAVTSNGGAVLLREADRAIGLTAKVARAFRDGRDPDHVVHSMASRSATRT
jgi:Transposase DDE domain group 1